MKKRLVSFLLSAAMMASPIATMTSLAANHNTNYSQYSAPSSSDYAYWNGSRVVRAPGTTASEIAWMQASLNWCIANRGLQTPYVEIDSSLGPACRVGIIAFQKAAGLNPDGSFGPATIQCMKDVLSGKRALNTSTQTTSTYSLCWPVSTTASNYKTITSSLGVRNAPVAGASVNHKGIDIGVGTNSKILATADGVVKFVGSNSARGKYVVIYHKSLGITSVYQHLSSYSVKVGQSVSKGQEIARSGNTGNSSGPHLHFELVLTGSAPSSVDCAWFSGAKLLDGHYSNSLIRYEYRK